MVGGSSSPTVMTLTTPMCPIGPMVTEQIQEMLGLMPGVKEVDVDENTVRFWQEIDEAQGKLVEIHEKYPVDKGHQQVQEN